MMFYRTIIRAQTVKVAEVNKKKVRGVIKTLLWV